MSKTNFNAGFWDRGLGKHGDALSEAARRCGGCDPWADEAGAVHLSM